MSIKVKILNGTDSACESFVAQIPEGKIAHMPTWSKTIEQATGLKNFYLVAKNDNAVCGVLPLMHVKSKLFGNYMVSQAFSDYGGPLAKSRVVLDILYNRAIELATEHNCEYIEFRNTNPLPYDLHLRADKVTMHLPLSLVPDEVWKKFKPETRNQVRKARKSGLIVISGGLELLDNFYRMWTVRMCQLGSPCYPNKLMRSILETFADNCRIFIVRLDSLTVGGGFTTFFNGFADMQWAATLTDYNKLCPNTLLYWSVIEHYCTAGASWFDFGRCTVHSPTYKFKQQWGPIEVKLSYQYRVKPGRQLSIASPDNPKYKRKVEAWKRLPLWLTRLAGPYISRNLP